jgi:outer membrane protein TolC
LNVEVAPIVKLTSVLFVSVLLCTVGIQPASAQGVLAPSLPSGSPFAGGVPDLMPTPGTLSLNVADVINRALNHNLGVLNAEESVDRARGARWIALSRLLPNLNGTLSESRQVVNLEAFGFPLNGQFPPVVGPFNVFDARVFLSQSVVDLQALNNTRAEVHNVAASRYALKSARDLVVLVAANLYLETIAASARAESARAQRDTSEALFNQATDLRQSGIVAGIEVIRAQVRLATDRQRVTSAENDFQKTKLQLARVIGLPLGQEFMLSQDIPYVPVPELSLQEALDRAYKDRPDYLAAQERARVAEARRAAALGEGLPSVQVNANYGAIGLTVGSARSTYTIVGALNVPIFEGGRLRGRLMETDADVRQRRAEVEDVRTQVYYDVRTAFLDLQATGERLQVATNARDLAAQQLTQARDRFAAGVASNIEVIQAQEAVALASEQYIGSLYAFNVSKAVLARSLGSAEEAVQRYLGGSNP